MAEAVAGRARQVAGAAQLDGGGGGRAGGVAGQAGGGAAGTVAGPHAAPGPLVEEAGGDDAEAGPFALEGDDRVVELVVVEQGWVEGGEALDRVVESVEARRHGSSIHEHLFDNKHLFVDFDGQRSPARSGSPPGGDQRLAVGGPGGSTDATNPSIGNQLALPRSGSARTS